MSGLLLAGLLLASPEPIPDQDVAAPPPAERVAVGVVVEPAYEVGADFWFISSIRVSGPIASGVGFDVEAGRVTGASFENFELHRILRGRVRIRRPGAGSSTAERYWIAGLFALPARKRVRASDAFERRVYTGATFGYGAEERLGRRIRIWNEAGVDGSDSVRLFATVGVKWRF